MVDNRLVFYGEVFCDEVIVRTSGVRTNDFGLRGQAATAEEAALHAGLRKESLVRQARAAAGPDAALRVLALDPESRVPERRVVLAGRIREHAVAWAVAAVDAARIDQINIYHASRLAMREAVMRLAPAADHLLVDALRIDCEQPQVPIIHGDALSASIAAASILAKVERDRMMCEWDAVFPAYGLASHKGYSTPKHLAALREFGPTPLHRQSFAPVWQNPVPQEAFGFMEEDAVLEESAAG